LKRLVIVLAAALVAVAVYAVTAPAGQQSVTPREFSALQKRVSTLEKKTKALTNTLKCLNTYAPLTAYGDSQNGTEGYVYQNSSHQDGLTTAVDFTGQGDTADANVAVVNKACIGSAKFSFSKVVALKPSSR
jgi:hypothetical protein